MGIFDRFPYSSTHEMNLDFMLGKATEIAEDMQQVTAGMEQVQAGLTAISEKTEQATQAAAQAAASASSIEGSVTAAEEAAEEAQMHNESAQTWANNALTYKADCQRAATEAAASSSSAAQAATAAAASEDTVATYAQAANASAQSAANNNDSAHQYANQASASASNATFHSSNAQTAATNANTSATNAETAATNAQTAATRTAALKDDCETLHRMCTAAVDQAATEAVNAANSAAQAAATKTDVETLVESLPEDFTDLNNTVNQLSDEIDTLDSDVTDLKSAVTNEFYNYTERTQTTAASGWRLNESDGLSSQDEGYQLKKFTVTAGDVVKVVSDDRFQFQTVASVPSYGTSNRVGITYGTGTFVLVVPETATYLIVSTPTESGAVVYTALSKLTDLGNDILELNQSIDVENRFANRIAYDASGIFDNSKLRVTVLNGLISITDASFGSSVYLEMKNPINKISGSSSATRYLTLKANHEYRLRTIPVSGSITGNDNPILLGISSGNSSMDYSVTIRGESIKFSYDNDTTVSVVLYVKYETTAEISFQYELADITDPDAKPLVPDYFISQIQTVRSNVQNDLMTVGRHGDNFVFITDIHWGGNYKHSPGLIKYLTDGRMVNLIVNGGDLIDGSSDKAAQIALQMQCVDAFNEIGIPMITAVGNHDYNSGYGTSANYFSDEEYFATAQHQNALDGMVYGGDTYFYWDKVSTKTRYIVLDSGANNIGNGTTIPSEQITWIQGVIGNTPADYHIIVVVHDLGNYSSGTNPIDENNPFVLITGAQTLFDALDALLSTHMIEAVFFGHTHYDSVTTTSGGIPLISTNSDAKWQYYGMTQPSDGTVDSQCFDVVTIDYSQKKIYMRRVGRGSDRVITYGT